MSRRPALVAVAFALVALLLIAALWRLSATTLELERSRAQALHSAAFEEDVRLSLWRMDAALAPMLARENAYRSQDFLMLGSEAVAGSKNDARLRQEATSSQQVPTLGDWTRNRCEQRLGTWRCSDGQPAATLLHALRRLEPGPPGIEILGSNVPPTGSANEDRQSPQSQANLNFLEFNQRQMLNQQLAPTGQGQDLGPAAPPSSQGSYQARWLAGELVLLRRIGRGNRAVQQLIHLDHQALEAGLLRELGGRLPDASLAPAAEDTDPGRRLALLPLQLVPIAPTGTPTTSHEVSPSTRRILALVWAGALIALSAAAALLSASVRLSQRRAAFVSAVSHELRTPLTTFRLYAGMLHDDMVPETARPEYTATLVREGDRLAHLVDNVLAYSRLERGKQGVSPEPQAIGELLHGVLPLLRERAEAGGLSLELHGLEQFEHQRVLADRWAVERILLNLVDNACKYAEAGPLQLRVETAGNELSLLIADRGPGLSQHGLSRYGLRQLFRPFHRSAHAAAGQAPGVGLGLSLCRRLARSMGGELRIRPATDGAQVELRLRVA